MYVQMKGTFSIWCTCMVQGGVRNTKWMKVHLNEAMQSKLLGFYAENRYLRVFLLCYHFTDFKHKVNT